MLFATVHCAIAMNKFVVFQINANDVFVVGLMLCVIVKQQRNCLVM